MPEPRAGSTPSETCAHLHGYTVPVYKLGHMGGAVPLTYKCPDCGAWPEDDDE